MGDNRRWCQPLHNPLAAPCQLHAVVSWQLSRSPVDTARVVRGGRLPRGRGGRDRPPPRKLVEGVDARTPKRVDPMTDEARRPAYTDQAGAYRAHEAGTTRPSVRAQFPSLWWLFPDCPANAPHHLRGRGASASVWGTAAGGASPLHNPLAAPRQVHAVVRHHWTAVGQVVCAARTADQR
jgi:hypothetical protein